MKAAWIAKALSEGKDCLRLKKAELALWHLSGGNVTFHMPWSEEDAFQSHGALVGAHNKLFTLLMDLSPSQWPEGRIPPTSQFHNRFCALLPARTFIQNDENTWTVDLIDCDRSHALDAWDFDLQITEDELLRLQPIASELTLCNLIRHENKVANSDKATLPWGQLRIALAKLGGHSANDILRWFSMLHFEGPSTVADVVSIEYQAEAGLSTMLQRSDERELVATLEPSECTPPRMAQPQYSGVELTKAGPYGLEVMLRDMPDGTFHLAFLSTMDNSRNPVERRKNFETILSPDAMLKLKLLIDETSGRLTLQAL